MSSHQEEKKKELVQLIAQLKSRIEQLPTDHGDGKSAAAMTPSSTNNHRHTKEMEETEKVKEFLFDREWTQKKAQLLLSKKLLEQENVRLKSRQEEIKQRVINSNNVVISLKEELRQQKERVEEERKEREAILQEKREIEQTVLLLQSEHECLDAQTNAMRDALSRSQREHRSLQEQLDSKKAAEVAMQDESAALKAKISQLENEQTALQISIVDHQANLHSQSLEIQTKTKTIEDLSAKLSRLDQRFVGLMQEKDAQRKEIAALHTGEKRAQLALDASVRVTQTATQTQRDLVASHERAMQLKDQQIAALREEVRILQQNMPRQEQGTAPRVASGLSSSQGPDQNAVPSGYTQGPPHSPASKTNGSPSQAATPMKTSEPPDRLCCICDQESFGLTVTCGGCQRECHSTCVRKRAREDAAAGASPSTCKRLKPISNK